jgi:hypothetical protein
LEQVEKRGFEVPIEVKVLDSNWSTRRAFTVEKKGRIAAERSRCRPSICLFPLKVVATDRNGRVARVRIGATCSVEKPEFLN